MPQHEGRAAAQEPTSDAWRVLAPMGGRLPDTTWQRRHDLYAQGVALLVQPLLDLVFAWREGAQMSPSKKVMDFWMSLNFLM